MRKVRGVDVEFVAEVAVDGEVVTKSKSIAVAVPVEAVRGMSLTGTGKVVAFVVDAEGRVTAALEWTTAPQTEVEKTFDACLTKALGEIRFPKPAGGGSMTVRFPMVFEPEG